MDHVWFEFSHDERVCAAGLSVCRQAGQYVGVISSGYETMQDIVVEFGYNFIMM